MTTIRLPSHLNAMTLARVVDAWPDDAGNVTIDFSPQAFVHPAGTVGLSCLIQRARERGQVIDFETDHCENIGYWERMRFFQNFDVEGIPAAGMARAPGDRFSEIRHVSDIEDVDELTGNIVQVTVPDDESLQIYSHVVSEALNNICQHSEATGFCASQYYPARNTVHFAFGDHGIGLREALATHNPSNDVEAIKLALRVGVSGRSRAAQLAEPGHMRNRGIGLSTIQKLVVGNGGTLTIWSGSIRYYSHSTGAGIRDVPPWQGTLVATTMPRNVVTAQFRDIMRELTAELRKVERNEERQRRRRR